MASNHTELLSINGDSNLFNVHNLALAIRFVAGIYILRAILRFANRAYVSVLKKIENAKKLEPIPGPRGMFILGMMPETLKNIQVYYDWMEKKSRAYGKTMLLAPVSLFSDGEILTTVPENIKHILKDNFNNYIKPPKLMECVESVFGDGIFSINHAHVPDNGELWKFQRKIIANVFSANRFRTYSKQVFQSEGKDMVAELLAKCEKSPNVDMQEFPMQFATRSIFKIGFGQGVKKALDYSIVSRVTELCCFRFVMPWYKYLGWAMPTEYEIKKGVAYIDTVIDDIISTRENDTRKELEEKADILSTILKKQMDYDMPISRKLIRDITLSVLIAGSDTTNCFLTWALYEVVSNPKVCAKLREEIDSKLNGELPGYDNLKDLPYLEDVLCESLRLHPPIAANQKYCVEDDTLPDGTFVSAGTTIQYSAWTMGRDPEKWENPLEYRPERWQELEKRPDAHELPVFQAGPRVCPGQAMTFIEVKVFLCMLLQNFDMELLKKEPATYVMNIALVMKGGLPIRFSKRSSKDAPALKYSLKEDALSPALPVKNSNKSAAKQRTTTTTVA